MILHVDMDAFYASVEQRDNPALKGKAIAVGGSAAGRGVVSAASYEARKFGVHSALPMRTALARCPHLTIIKTRMEHYASVSRQIREIFHRFTPLVEPLALDEAFLDVGGSAKLFGSAEAIGREVQQAIQRELNLVASVGVAPTKFVAKVASDVRKPAGFVVVEEAEVQAFLDPLPVGRIWGVGARADQRLAELGIHKVVDLRKANALNLQQVIGQAATAHLKRLAEGIDLRSVVPDREAKSISHETTFPVDVDDMDVLTACLLRLTEQVARRLRRHQRYASGVTIKVRFGDFSTVTRSQSLNPATQSTDEIWKSVRDELLHRAEITRPVRLVGVGLHNLSDSRVRQMSLFDETTQRDRHVDAAADSIVDRFGSGAIRRAGALQRRDKP